MMMIDASEANRKVKVYYCIILTEVLSADGIGRCNKVMYKLCSTM